MDQHEERSSNPLGPQEQIAIGSALQSQVALRGFDLKNIGGLLIVLLDTAVLIAIATLFRYEIGTALFVGLMAAAIANFHTANLAIAALRPLHDDEVDPARPSVSRIRRLLRWESRFGPPADRSESPYDRARMSSADRAREADRRPSERRAALETQRETLHAIQRMRHEASVGCLRAARVSLWLTAAVIVVAAGSAMF